MLTLWLIGTIGYVLIDNYTWFNAFYMTIITVATVGYGEVEPLSNSGKIFTAFLILTSFGTFAYAVSSITKFVFDGEFNDFYKNRKLNASIDKLSDHIITKQLIKHSVTAFPQTSIKLCSQCCSTKAGYHRRPCSDSCRR